MLMNIELIEHGCLGYRLLCLPDGTVIKPFPEPGATIQKSRDSLAVQSPILPGRLFTLHERMVVLFPKIAFLGLFSKGNRGGGALSIIEIATKKILTIIDKSLFFFKKGGRLKVDNILRASVCLKKA